MLVTKTSSLTGITHTLDIDVIDIQLEEISNGTNLIQRIVPNLTPGEREFLLTGITPEEWDEHFKDLEED